MTELSAALGGQETSPTPQFRAHGERVCRLAALPIPVLAGLSEQTACNTHKLYPGQRAGDEQQIDHRPSAPHRLPRSPSAVPAVARPAPRPQVQQGIGAAGGGRGGGGGSGGGRLGEEDASGGSGGGGCRLLGVGQERLGHQPAGRAGMQPARLQPVRVLVVRHAAQPVGHGEGKLVLLEQRLGLPPRPVLVVGVLLHVHGPQPLGLVDEGPLLRLGQQLPLSAQALADLRVVHLGVLLGHLSSLRPRPHHEGVHRPLDVIHRLGHGVPPPPRRAAARPALAAASSGTVSRLLLLLAPTAVRSSKSNLGGWPGAAAPTPEGAERRHPVAPLRARGAAERRRRRLPVRALRRAARAGRPPFPAWASEPLSAPPISGPGLFLGTPRRRQRPESRRDRREVSTARAGSGSRTSGVGREGPRFAADAMLLGSLRCSGKPWTGRRSEPARCHRRPRSSEGSPPRRVAGPGGTGSAAARAPGGAGRPAHSRPAPPAGARPAARSSHILAGRRSQAAAGRRGPPGSRRRTNFAKFRRDTGRSACRAAPPSPAAARLGFARDGSAALLRKSRNQASRVRCTRGVTAPPGAPPDPRWTRPRVRRTAGTSRGGSDVRSPQGFLCHAARFCLVRVPLRGARSIFRPASGPAPAAGFRTFLAAAPHLRPPPPPAAASLAGCLERIRALAFHRRVVPGASPDDRMSV
ncbi:uncharacterized protein [Taeniopygia guttata]|uniref:uncharacterized protein n=1 Tax=Taeniopygia guttata TaxID=59729 RepID=UPI003BB99B0B